jgi:hypothetical protein
MSTQTYYAVCHVGGPISVRIEAESVDAAERRFRALDLDECIDRARTDAEDDLDIDGADASESQFGDALELAGYIEVRDLDPIDNAHAGTRAHLAGGWVLWGPDAEKAS